MGSKKKQLNRLKSINESREDKIDATVNKEEEVEKIEEKQESEEEVSGVSQFPLPSSGNVSSKWAISYAQKPKEVQRRLPKRTHYS